MQPLKRYLTYLGNIRTEKISVGLPFGLGSFEITPNRAEQRAAWALYVELTTRIAVQPFNPETGLMRGVLDSLYLLFGITRQILRDAGPDVAQGSNSFGPLAIEILTKGIAPFTTKWHQKLLSHESSRPNGFKALDYERSWDQFPQMLLELENLQKEMRRYTDILAEIAGAKGVNSNQKELAKEV